MDCSPGLTPIRASHPARHARHGLPPDIRGLTIIELMVTIAVLGVLLALAVPSFASLARQWQQDAAVDAFVGDLRLARSTATRTSRPVVMCAINSAGACSGQTGWSAGWMVFSDLNGDGSRDAGEPVIAQRGVQAGIEAMVENSANPSAATLRFRSNGTPLDRGLSVNVVPRGATSPTRTIILNALGRARVSKAD